MLQRMFTIHDKKAEAYLPPWFLPETAQAERTFGDCVNDPKHAFSLHPEDYTLMALGTFDNNTGMCITTNPESLGNGLQYIKNTPQPGQTELDIEPPDLAAARAAPPEKRFKKTIANTPNVESPKL